MSRSLSVLLCLLSAACAATRPREGGSASAPHVAAPPAPGVSSSPPAKSADTEILNNDCLACHTRDLILQQRLTDKQWTKVVEKMHNWGAPTEPADVNPLTSYLTATYSRSSGPFVPETISVEAAAALFKARPDGVLAGGDRERGLALYQERCLPCHEEDGRGGPDGVTLVGRHVLDRAPDFVEVVRTGRGRMPAFDETRDGEAADLLAYLRSLP